MSPLSFRIAGDTEVFECMQKCFGLSDMSQLLGGGKHFVLGYCSQNHLDDDDAPALQSPSIQALVIVILAIDGQSDSMHM